MRYLFLLLALISSCTTTRQPERWELPSGEKLVCRTSELTDCGITITGCGPDQSLAFECLTEVKYCGPGDAFEPDIYDEKGPGQ